MLHIPPYHPKLFPQQRFLPPLHFIIQYYAYYSAFTQSTTAILFWTPWTHTPGIFKYNYFPITTLFFFYPFTTTYIPRLRKWVVGTWKLQVLTIPSEALITTRPRKAAGVNQRGSLGREFSWNSAWILWRGRGLGRGHYRRKGEWVHLKASG